MESKFQMKKTIQISTLTRSFERSLCIAALIMVTGFVSGCANFYAGREQPEIHLTSIQPLPREGLEQRFLIGLNIVNPDRRKLNISGLSYSLLLNGRKVASGVSGKMTPIPGFSESKVRLQASTNLISSLRVMAGLLSDPNPIVDYEIVTKIRTSWWPMPIELSEQGSIGLGDYSP